MENLEAEKRRHHNNFMMDFENYVLAQWDSRQGIPTGLRRYENEAWAELMRSNLEYSDTTWEAYVEWVSQGGGDEYFRPWNVNDGPGIDLADAI